MKLQDAWKLGQIARLIDDGLAEEFDLESREEILAEHHGGAAAAAGDFDGWASAQLGQRWREGYQDSTRPLVAQ